MTLPNEKTQNFQIKMVCQIRLFVVYEPLGRLLTSTNQEQEHLILTLESSGK